MFLGRRPAESVACSKGGSEKGDGDGAAADGKKRQRCRQRGRQRGTW